MAGPPVGRDCGTVQCRHWRCAVQCSTLCAATCRVPATHPPPLRHLASRHRSMLAEHRSAALERRPPNLSPSLAQLEGFANRITALGARIGANTIDPRVMPLTSLVLSMPPAVRLMQPALRAVTGSILATIFSCARVGTGSALAAPGCAANGAAAGGTAGSQGDGSGGADGAEGGDGGEAGSTQQSGKHGSKKPPKRGTQAALQATPYAASSDYFRKLVENEEITAAMHAVMETHGALVEACAGARHAVVAGFRCTAQRLAGVCIPIIASGGRLWLAGWLAERCLASRSQLAAQHARWCKLASAGLTLWCCLACLALSQPPFTSLHPTQPSPFAPTLHPHPAFLLQRTSSVGAAPQTWKSSAPA